MNKPGGYKYIYTGSFRQIQSRPFHREKIDEERKMGTTDLEKQNLEAHVDLCEQRYKNLETRLTKIEEKVESIHEDIHSGNKSMVKVIIGATGTIVAGLLSTIVVLLLKFPG